jgi:hypothetical protein
MSNYTPAGKFGPLSSAKLAQSGDGDSTDTKTGTPSKDHFHQCARQYVEVQLGAPAILRGGILLRLSRWRDILQLDFFHHLVELPDEFARSQGWRTHAFLTATNERQPPAAILDWVRVKDGAI